MAKNLELWDWCSKWQLKIDSCLYLQFSIVVQHIKWTAVEILFYFSLNFFLPTQRKFASETGYFDETSKSDFWDKFVNFANEWNKNKISNKWTTLQAEDESKYTETMETSH